MNSCAICNPGRDPQEIEMQAVAYGWKLESCGVKHPAMREAKNDFRASFELLTLFVVVLAVAAQIESILTNRRRGADLGSVQKQK